MAHNWFIVHAYSNFEKQVANSIKEQAIQRGMEDKFSEILVPTEDVVQVRKGRKVQSERKFFPGYVLVKMEMSDEAYHLVKKTNKVAGFLGSQNKPIPITKEEVDLFDLSCRGLNHGPGNNDDDEVKNTCEPI